MNFFNTFRARLLIILAFLLVATLGVQLYVNLSSRRENVRLRELQEQALVAGITLGFNSMQSNDRLGDLISREGQTFFDEQTTERIQDIIVINDKWQVSDSLNPEYLPTTDENGNLQYRQLSELTDLPSLPADSRLGEDLEKFPNSKIVSEDTDGEAHAIPVETNQGRWYVMVILKTDRQEIFQKATRPLVYTLLILLLATATTFFLVWQFTRPIANLSNAAQRIAAGDLSVRVRDAERSDEIGRLAWQFNQMTAELEKTRELETQLQEAEKSAVVGRLASAIAHEIRNPLNYINLTLDHLRAKFAPQDSAKRGDFEKLTAQLKTEVGRINRQISDFLRYSRPAKLNLQPIEPRRVVEDSLRIVEPQAVEQNIVISLIERENVPQILGDAEVLRSVFSNLFINAVQAMEKTGGSLNVTIDSDEEFVRIEIADTGDGIPTENLDKIFEPYFSTKETGTGLGLAIVKKIVDDHRGTIAVESELNAGTKFTVKLPNVKS
ncbi:MAG: HAMP domain-containing protein [Pyrinomonadaceae bacterium]|nr:HAMP domain-containing protein [Pyrinomonadaceae bacterium]